MKTVKYIMLIAAAATALSCTKNFREMNTNPEQAYEEHMSHDGLAVGGPFTKMLQNAIPMYQMDGNNEYGSDRYQVIQDLAGNCFSGYFAATNSGFTQNNLYNVNNDGWSKFMFNDFFTRFTPQWLTVNQFREGNETLCALADVVKILVLDTYGRSQRTADARDNGGVLVNGALIPERAFFETIGGQGDNLIGSFYTYSMTNIRLGEMSLGYDIPINKWVKWIKGLNLSVVGRNLAMIYCKAPFDPELIQGAGNYSSGIDYFMVPSTRNIGFSAKITF